VEGVIWCMGRLESTFVLSRQVAGGARAQLKEPARQRDLDESVWFTGGVSDADRLRYIAGADGCVDPDVSNPFNDRWAVIKMREHMADGKAIVAGNLPEYRESSCAWQNRWTSIEKELLG